MKRMLFAVALCAALGMVTFYAQAPAGQKPASADPYANNPDAGKSKFPLAAPAGKDSGAKDKPIPGSLNTGAVDPSTWKYGPQNPRQAGAKLWNPVKLKLQQGGKVTGGTVFSATDPLTYCAMANAGYDYIWTEMQHNDRDWNQAARMWRTCPHAKAVPGARIAYSDEREIQRATDAGALVIVVPTVDTVQEAWRRATGRTSRHSASAARAAVRVSMPQCGATCRAATAPQPTTISCSS